MLRKSGVLGTVTVKMNELMTSATHTASYDLMDGRKAVGGLLELRLRHRAPLRVSPLSLMSFVVFLSHATRSVSSAVTLTPKPVDSIQNEAMEVTNM